MRVEKYPIRIIEGNSFTLSIELQQIAWGHGTGTTSEFVPLESDRIRVWLVSKAGERIEAFNAVVSANELLISFDEGICKGLYDIEIFVYRANGTRLHCRLEKRIHIVPTTDKMGIEADTIKLTGAVLLVIDGVSLQWDDTPTEGSGAVVTSDGIYHVLQELREDFDNAKIEVDEELDGTSANPVQNKAITEAIEGIEDDLQTLQSNSVNVEVDAQSREFAITNANGVKIGTIKVGTGISGVATLAFKDKAGHEINITLPNLAYNENTQYLEYIDAIGAHHNTIKLSNLQIKGVFSEIPSMGDWALGDLILVGADSSYELNVFDGTNWLSLGSINNVSLVADQVGFTPNGGLSATNVQDAIEEVRKDINDIVFSGKDIFRKTGYIAYPSGSVSSGQNWKYTDYLAVDKNSDIIINGVSGPSSGCCIICFYDADKNVIPNSSVEYSSGMTSYTITKENIPANAVYFRSSTAVGTMSDNTYIRFFSVEKVLSNIDFPAVQNKINTNRDYIRSFFDISIYSIDATIINKNNGQAQGNYANYKSTDFIEIDKSADIILRKCGGQNGTLAIAFYDVEKNFISTFDYSSAGLIMIGTDTNYSVAKENIPEGAVYIRSCIYIPTVTDDTILIFCNSETVSNLNKRISATEKTITSLETTIDSYSKYIPTETILSNSILSENGYIGINGTHIGTYSDVKHSDYIELQPLSTIIAKIRVNSQIGALCFYDSNYEKLRVITAGAVQELTDVTLESQSSAQEKFMRVCSSYAGYDSVTITTNGQMVPELGDLFDYSKVLAMPKQLVRSMVETASNGLCTALYDENDMPSLMYKIPIISLGALNSNLGDLTTPHPAFVVNGVQKSCLYMACFQTTVYNGVPVSWFGLSPTNGGNSFENIRSKSKAKGTGWHLETIYERSLAILLSVKKNGEKARGNRCYGRDTVEGYEYESVQREDGALPGTNVFAAKWINGTQPLSWSHNGERFGIFDLIGGYWEWCDLIKVVNGQIYLAQDNNFLADENEWVATGVYIDIDSEGNLSFNISFNESAASNIRYKKWTNMLCNPAYDSVNLELRKKLQQLLICPRLSSSDSSALFNFDGQFWMKKDQTNYLIHGGAEEYQYCGFGEFAISYPKTEGHSNMGSRLCYIE